MKINCKHCGSELSRVMIEEAARKNSGKEKGWVWSHVDSVDFAKGTGDLGVQCKLFATPDRETA